MTEDLSVKNKRKLSPRKNYKADYERDLREPRIKRPSLRKPPKHLRNQYDE